MQGLYFSPTPNTKSKYLLLWRVTFTSHEENERTRQEQKPVSVKGDPHNAGIDSQGWCWMEPREGPCLRRQQSSSEKVFSLENRGALTTRLADSRRAAWVLFNKPIILWKSPFLWNQNCLQERVSFNKSSFFLVSFLKRSCSHFLNFLLVLFPPDWNAFSYIISTN